MKVGITAQLIMVVFMLPGFVFSQKYVLNQSIDFSTQLPGIYSRPDVIIIDGQLFLATAATMNMTRIFELYRMEANDSLTFMGTLGSAANQLATDIRIATDGSKLYYGIETVEPQMELSCGKNYLSAYSYSILNDKDSSMISDSLYKITSGCPSGVAFVIAVTEGSVTLQEKAKKVDDPSPIFFNGNFYLMARGWSGPVQYLYKMDGHLQLLETIELDLQNQIGSASISQNALVNINGTIFLISGVGMGGPREGTSSIKAITLADDLKTAAGTPIDLVAETGTYYSRVTAARFYNGKLFFNYLEKSKDGGNDKGYIGICRVSEGPVFSDCEHILFQEENAKMDNHSSFDVLNDTLYVVYQSPQGTLLAKKYSPDNTSGIKETSENMVSSALNAQYENNLYTLIIKDISGKVMNRFPVNARGLPQWNGLSLSGQMLQNGIYFLYVMNNRNNQILSSWKTSLVR
ncbi:MAG: hypothetical protein HQK83_02895 [Fibrobacteria bacterium]|nr:hypothetical protein [Fibrobacteria bacterium]